MGSRRVALEQARNDASQALQAVDESLRELGAPFENKLRKRRDALRSALGLVALVGDQDRAEGDPDASTTRWILMSDFADVEPVSAVDTSRGLVRATSRTGQGGFFLSACVSAYDADAALVRDAERDASEKLVVEPTATPSSA